MHDASTPGSGLRWFKSSYSGGSASDCVETALHSAGAQVRDSKDPHGPTLGFSSVAWEAFVSAVRRGEITN